VAELLEALGRQPNAAHCLRLTILVGAITTTLLVAASVLTEATSISIVLVQTVIWAVWLAWLGVIFPRNGHRDSELPCAYPYRRAFFREILFGISIAFSQFLRPATVGALHGDSSFPPAAAVLMGVPLVAMGAALIAVGVSALGLARTLFVHEYVPERPKVVRNGIYGFVRHPLFLGGALVSIGLAICTGNQLAIEVGLLNALVCPLYIHLEDQRCTEVLGHEYANYSSAVGGVVPRRRSAIRLAAHLRHALGRIAPRVGRANVSK
jgi:protein-S-isoprenylcysteine O-methyltransferase Ste14